jgi:acetyl esterase/lipase
MTMAIDEQDIPYAVMAGEPILARVYHNSQAAMGQGIVSVHGGAWCKNDRTSAHVLDRGLANLGLTVFALDFRQGPEHKFPTATRDITAGIRFVRANAARFGLDADRIGIVGSSSGGQSVLLTTLTCGAAMHEGTAIADADAQPMDAAGISARVAYALALWPVSDPLYRYQYAQEVGRDDLLAGHHAYFDSEEQMAQASIQRLLDDGEASVEAPVWIVQPGGDTNVPQPMTFDLLRALQDKGANLEYTFYPNEPHALTREDTPAAARCIADAGAFIQRQLQGSCARFPARGSTIG